MTTATSESASSKFRVLVLRAAKGGSALAEELRARGLEPLLVPSIQTVGPLSYAVLDAALANLETFDWLLFTSASAVEVFARRGMAVGSIRTAPGSLRIAAIGPATARAVQEHNLSVHLVPPQAVAESMLEALLPHLTEPGGRPASFLLVRAEEARELLPEGLRAAGAKITVAPAYRTVVPEASVALIRHLFGEPERQPHAIAFTSASTVQNLLALCHAAEVRIPASALRIAIGPITSQALVEVGHPAHAEALEANVASLADAVFATLRAANPRA